MSTVNRVVVVLIALLAGSTLASAQPPSSLCCMERLDLPQYNLLARLAKHRGEVEARIRSSPDGTTSVLGVKGERHLLNEAVRKSLVNVRVRSECVDEMVLVFDFRIEGPVTQIAHQDVTFEAPNRFVIRVTRPPDFTNP